MTTASSILMVVLLLAVVERPREQTQAEPAPLPPATDAPRHSPEYPSASRADRPPPPRVAHRAKRAAPVKPKTRPRSRHGFQWPSNARLTSLYGPRWGGFHHGIDIACAPGERLKPARPGKVVQAAWAPIYGKTVIIRHPGGYRTLYAHMRGIWVNRGERVTWTTTIGTCGSSGASTGPHLHLEVYKNGKIRNPLPLMPRRR